jgi:hypothetical protein
MRGGAHLLDPETHNILKKDVKKPLGKEYEPPGKYIRSPGENNRQQARKEKRFVSVGSPARWFMPAGG